MLRNVAAVSLLVGGIGIMNIMLVSVTERTREIGIRLAIGASENKVLLQFLVEAVVFSAAGGLVGIALGVGGSLALASAMGWPFVLTPFWIFVVFVISMAIGVVFGFYPARKAAQMNPGPSGSWTPFVGEIVDKPVVREGRVEVGKTIPITATLDHRYMDGWHISRLLHHLHAYLENHFLFEPAMKGAAPSV